MTYLPHIWVYAGATCEDVYTELDDKASDRTNLEVMSSPQLAFVASGYSKDLVQKLALDMWSEIQSLYEEAFERGISFHDLTPVVSAQIVERPVNYYGEMPVLEVTIWRYYLMHSIEPLMQVTVQKRPFRHLNVFGHAA